MSFWLYILLAFVVGLITGIKITMFLVRLDISRANLSSDQRRFIYDLLGIR